MNSIKEALMKYAKQLFITAVAAIMLGAGLVYEASAQRRVVRRPIIVRTYVYRDPFWYSRYYDPYYYSPYRRYAEQRYYLERDLEGNRRELAKHLRKYRADGVITAKERRELEDDYKDVRESTMRLRRFRRNY